MSNQNQTNDLGLRPKGFIEVKFSHITNQKETIVWLKWEGVDEQGNKLDRDFYNGWTFTNYGDSRLPMRFVKAIEDGHVVDGYSIKRDVYDNTYAQPKWKNGYILAGEVEQFLQRIGY